MLVPVATEKRAEILAMSLRFRLIALVFAALSISLVLGGAVARLNASHSVRKEMRSALRVGRQTVENAMANARHSSDPRHDIESLVQSFEGNRHLRVMLTGDRAAVAAPAVQHSPFGEVPAWFAWLIDVPDTIDRVPVQIAGQSYGTIVLETDPHNEMAEVWNEFNDSLIVLALFCGQTILLIYLFVGRALRPLRRLASAFEQIGRGDYSARVDGPLTPELSRLHDSFNRMALRLAGADADNRQLNEQLLVLQEQERAELARDLHDEVSPFLFAIKVDAANLSRLLAQGRASEASEHLQLIEQSVLHMQREVRDMLGRLRPPGLAEFGLSEAIGNLIEFWRRRHSEIDFRIAVAPECESLRGIIDTTIYRVVQECLSNAVRHANPGAIEVRIERSRDTDPAGPDEVTVAVTDDGPGLRGLSEPGFGLRGMGERIRAVGGRLTLRDRPGGGLAIVARMPCEPEAALAGTGRKTG